MTSSPTLHLRSCVRMAFMGSEFCASSYCPLASLHFVVVSCKASSTLRRRLPGSATSRDSSRCFADLATGVSPIAVTSLSLLQHRHSKNALFCFVTKVPKSMRQTEGSQRARGK